MTTISQAVEAEVLRRLGRAPKSAAEARRVRAQIYNDYPGVREAVLREQQTARVAAGVPVA